MNLLGIPVHLGLLWDCVVVEKLFGMVEMLCTFILLLESILFILAGLD